MSMRGSCSSVGLSHSHVQFTQLTNKLASNNMCLKDSEAALVGASGSG